MKHTKDRALVFEAETIGESQSLTPEGYLYCRNVPIARIGSQDYLNGELEPDAKDAAGPDGVIHVERRPEDVFHEDTIASFEGKPVVDEHPDDMLHPGNTKLHIVGVTLNPRRGDLNFNDYLMADLLIYDQDAIAAVRAGKRQVSCGYDAQYEVLGPGRARQHQIIGNHVALVPKGRCGPSCAIGDADMTTKTEKKSGFRSFLDGLNGLIKDAATAEGYKMGEEGELTIDESLPSKSGMESHTQLSGDTHIHIHAGPNESTTIAPTTDEGTEGTASEMEAEEDEDKKGFMDAMSAAYDAEMKKVKDRKASKDKKAKDKKAKDAGEEEEDEEGNKETKDADTEEEGEAESEGSVETADADEEEEEKKDTKDKKAKDKKGTKDSAPLKDDFQALKSDVEILVPGLKMPTFDAAASHTATMDSMCLMRRRALAAHMRTEDGEQTLTMLNGGKPLKLAGLTCDAAGVFFNSAVQFAKDRNNEVGRLQRARTKDGASKPQTPADFNKATQAYYDAKKPKPKSA